MSPLAKKRIEVLTTGGTIDKSYNEAIGKLENNKSLLIKILKKLRLPYLDIKITEVMAKDSSEMDDTDREIILRQIQNKMARCHPVIILHGTDSLEVTARYILEHMEALEAPVVFTGSMKPIGFTDSDAAQNFVESLMAAQLLTPGVYVCFHGQVFSGDNVAKDWEKGTFKSLR